MSDNSNGKRYINRLTFKDKLQVSNYLQEHKVKILEVRPKFVTLATEVTNETKIFVTPATVRNLLTDLEMEYEPRVSSSGSKAVSKLQENLKVIEEFVKSHDTCLGGMITTIQELNRKLAESRAEVGHLRVLVHHLYNGLLYLDIHAPEGYTIPSNPVSSVIYKAGTPR